MAWIEKRTQCHIPWLGHGINNLKHYSILNWIPRSSRGMTAAELIHATMLRGNDIEFNTTTPWITTKT
ncbi:hypothetical protein RMONA_06545 [Rickettsia monacensis]|uniref:Uncharacterized protein n=1 Tax=Rickettsia monacensis TaxID=109232 RepID=A0A0B7J3U1_9RICK|nr:hypothetical protein [Rickettsia monacensis]CDI30013.1 hypothetical protein RMONA_6880 [Rickettsia monacensis IrR/Munich]CEO17665.1 hypothetical protein RMONA_06545 [Rickettsia monacensis]